MRKVIVKTHGHRFGIRYDARRCGSHYHGYAVLFVTVKKSEMDLHIVLTTHKCRTAWGARRLAHDMFLKEADDHFNAEHMETRHVSIH